MPLTVKIDLNTTRLQQVVLQDASPRQAGVMTKLQVQQLAALVAIGPVTPEMQWTVTPVKRRDYIAALNEYVVTDSAEEQVTVTLPLATPANKGQVIGVKSITFNLTQLDVAAQGGQLIDNAATYSFVQQLASVVFVSNGSGWDISYFYPGKPVV